LPQISWEHCSANEGLPLEFDGVPYLWLGRREYQCHQGNDKAKSQKIKYRNNKNNSLMSDHTSSMRTKKHTQPTKKLDCPVKFYVKKIFRFYDFSIEKDTKWNRSVASKKLREYLKTLRDSVNNENITNKTSKHGILEFVTCFPQGIYFLIQNF